MIYMVIDADEAEAQRRAEEGFELVKVFMERICGNREADECGDHEFLEFYWPEKGLRIAWNVRGDFFRVHGDRRLQYGIVGIRNRMHAMEFWVHDMAHTDAEEAQIVEDLVSDGAGGKIQRPVYLREPVRIIPTMLSEVKGLVPDIYRMGSVICESQLCQL